MPPSQLKRLKQSLRDQGITGPQKSKKQKRQQHGANADQRLEQQARLQQIRDSFNPFEIKAPARNAKFASMSDRKEKVRLERPGVTKSMGERARRENLLPELQNRAKTGGIMDRRIGETDASMTPEEKALQRFMQEKRRRKNTSVFDLEADDEAPQTGLTHLGRALDLDDDAAQDDFDEQSLSGSEAGSQKGDSLLKRRRESANEAGEAESDGEQDTDMPARKKSKHEVMQEVMAKSKLHKYERQKAKEDDDDLRARLDADLGDLLPFLQGRKVEPPKPPPVAEPAINADRLAMMEGRLKAEADKEYDVRLRQLTQDKRAAPTERTKTEEERAKDEVERLQRLEAERQRRMRGEAVDESEDEDGSPSHAQAEEEVPDEDERDDAAAFGLKAPSKKQKLPVLDDEDEFELDEDLMASGSDAGSAVDNGENGSDSDSDDSEGLQGGQDRDDEEDEFVKGILDDRPTKVNGSAVSSQTVAFTYPCPRAHPELLAVFEGVTDSDVPVVIQRIRALYHPSLSAENKEKMADFARALVEHLYYMGIHSSALSMVEQIIRHLHSLSRTYPLEIATAFRDKLGELKGRPEPDAGDLIILSAIGSIYPTSDHFHQVVTPAMLLITRWLGLTDAVTEKQQRRGACMVSICLQYQSLAKRFVPEAVRFTLKVLDSTPQPAKDILDMHIANMTSLADQYRDLSAFTEIFSPHALATLQSLNAQSAVKHLRILLSQARLARRPLELHHHRPQPIRTSIPKFEDNFMPGRHYDPDRERSETAKLNKELKREKKGAMRELRKDSSFVAREALREKKEKDAAYETKFRKLVAQINSEEGQAGNEYERVRDKRKRAKK